MPRHGAGHSDSFAMWSFNACKVLKGSGPPLAPLHCLQVSFPPLGFGGVFPVPLQAEQTS